MRFRSLLAIFLTSVMLSACGSSESPQFQDAALVQQGVQGTAAAIKTATAVVERNRQIRETALPVRNTHTPIPSVTVTVTVTETPMPTAGSSSSSSGSGVPEGYSDGCTSGGCHRIVFNNKTGDTVTVILEGPGKYWFVVPDGNGQVVWILPGFYNAEIRGCGGKTATFANPLNSGWFLDIKCDFFE